jgi:hypothetical protein
MIELLLTLVLSTPVTLQWNVTGGSEMIACPLPPPDPYTGEVPSMRTTQACFREIPPETKSRTFPSMIDAVAFVKNAPRCAAPAALWIGQGRCVSDFTVVTEVP